jgi:prefoldin subunit 5
MTVKELQILTEQIAAQISMLEEQQSTINKLLTEIRQTGERVKALLLASQHGEGS